jgi:putative ABC transport system permease protein
VVVVEVALGLTLLIGAGLLMRSFVALRDVNLGLRPDHVFQAVAVLPPDRYETPEQVAAFLGPLLARLKALPGVEHASVSTATQPGSGADTRIDISGTAQDGDRRALFQHVSQEFFQVLRVGLKHGRPFTEADVSSVRSVAVVNETFARRYLPNEDPIGRRVRLRNSERPGDPAQGRWFEIVGVVGDVPNRGLHLPADPDVWIPSTLSAASMQVLLVRTSHDPRAIARAVHREVFAADPAVPLAYPSALEDWIAERAYAGPRFGVLLMTVFGCVGLLLVATGVYSVLAYSTAQRTHEIGIRMALGAKAEDVLAMVVSSGLRLVFAGAVAGTALSLLAGPVISSQLFGVTAYDPATLAVAYALLTATAALACWIPARRAARVDPIVALHE